MQIPLYFLQARINSTAFTHERVFMLSLDLCNPCGREMGDIHIEHVIRTVRRQRAIDRELGAILSIF